MTVKVKVTKIDVEGDPDEVREVVADFVQEGVHVPVKEKPVIVVQKPQPVQPEQVSDSEIEIRTPTVRRRKAQMQPIKRGYARLGRRSWTPEEIAKVNVFYRNPANHYTNGFVKREAIAQFAQSINRTTAAVQTFLVEHSFNRLLIRGKDKQPREIPPAFFAARNKKNKEAHEKAEMERELSEQIEQKVQHPPHEAETMLRRHAITPMDIEAERRELFAKASHTHPAQVRAFPRLACVSVDQEILVSMFKRFTAVDGSTMNYAIDGAMLGIQGIVEWKRFLEDVIYKSHVVSDALGVRNKFSVKGSGKESVLHYG